MIEPGDLVMVVRGHPCVLETFGGVPYRVRSIHHIDEGWHCGRCGQDGLAREEKIGANLFGAHQDDNPGTSIPVAWLRKIEPIAEPEAMREKETA